MNYDEATIDTLKESLLDKEEKGEFLEMIFAAISHASNEPGVTYRGLKLESVKTFFLEKILRRKPMKHLNLHAARVALKNVETAG